MGIAAYTGRGTSFLHNAERWYQRIRSPFNQLRAGRSIQLRTTYTQSFWIPREDNAQGRAEPNRLTSLPPKPVKRRGLMYRVVSDLTSVGDALRRCRCGRLFVREGRRLHCSDKCSAKYRQRRRRRLARQAVTDTAIEHPSAQVVTDAAVRSLTY